MHAHLLDRYREGHSLLHRLDPRVKVVATVLFILGNVLLPDGAWLAFALVWALVLWGNWLAKLGMDYTFRRSFVALPFALAAVTAIWALPGRPLADWSIGPLRLVATDAGVIRFASIVVRSWLSIQAAILLTATTQFPDLMHALRHLRVPGPIVSIISFMYRYLFVLADEATRLLRARESRSARLGRGRGGSLRWRARIAGNMAGQLFLRSYDRSDRVYSAMLARGFSGELMTLNPHMMRPRDWFFVASILVLLVTIQLIARLIG